MGALLDSLLGGLGYVGESLDKPGATVRGLLGGQGAGALANLIPFSDTLGFTDPSQRMSGRGLLEHYGALQPKGEDEGFGFGDLLGMGVDMATDPLNWAGGGAIKRLAGLRHAAEAENLRRDALLANGAMTEGAAAATQAVDKSGRPLRLYHGSPTAFEAYDLARQETPDALARGVFTHTDPNVASGYAMAGQPRFPGVNDVLPPANVRSHFLDARNIFDMQAQYPPEVLDALESAGGVRTLRRYSGRPAATYSGRQIHDLLQEASPAGRDFAEMLQSGGYDAIRNASEGGHEYVAFHPDQLRMAHIVPNSPAPVPRLAPLLAALAGENTLAHGGF